MELRSSAASLGRSRRQLGWVMVLRRSNTQRIFIRAMVSWSLCVLFLAALPCDALEVLSSIHGDARECECPRVDTEQDDAGKEVHLRLARSGTGIRFAWSGGHCSDAVFATCWGGLS